MSFGAEREMIAGLELATEKLAFLGRNVEAFSTTSGNVR
jgi:hypothetical protein